MADTNKVSLAHLKMAMNTIKEYQDQNGANFSLAYDSSTGILKLMHGDQEISSVTISSPASSSIPCTGITLSANSLSFTSKDTQTLTATKQPSNTTDVVTWSVSPADIVRVNGGVVTPIANGTCTITATCGSQTATCSVTVSAFTTCTSISLNQTSVELTADNTTVTLVPTIEPSNCTEIITWSSNATNIATVNNGVVTAVGNGSAVITATCGTQSATCNVTVSGLNEVTESVIYQLPQETVFNGTNTYIETGIALFGDEYLNTDWTILTDFTDNGSSTQASIFHCIDDASPFPGVCVKFYNGNVIASVYGKGVTLCSQDTNRHKFVITKSGNTFTLYNESMTQLDVKTFDSLATVAQTLLLGCTESPTGYKNPYMKGTLHRFKVVEGVMSREDCLAWIGATS